MKWWVRPYLETQLHLQRFNMKMNTFPVTPDWLWELLKEINFDFYLISDTHFYHTKIGEYCERPDGWEKLIVDNWNETVKPNDVVLHLGDFAFGNKYMAKDVRDLLNGRIIMVKGNHDRHGVAWFSDVGIEAITPFIICRDNARYLFSHVPQYPLDDGVLNIHGHVHNIRPLTWERQHMYYRNCSVEAIDYKPIRFKDLK